MKTIWGAVLLAMMMLATAALAADLDTPRIGAAVCAPEEENGSVVLHEAPDGRSETLMRYFQGAPLQVLDLADGWAHVRMGMTGESLEGYIRQERLKYGAEAMREVQQYAEMPGFDAVSYTHLDVYKRQVIASVPTDSNDKPRTEQVMRTVYVETYGKTYTFTKLED